MLFIIFTIAIKSHSLQHIYQLSWHQHDLLPTTKEVWCLVCTSKDKGLHDCCREHCNMCDGIKAIFVRTNIQSRMKSRNLF